MHIHPKLQLLDAETGLKIRESEIRQKTAVFSSKIREKIVKNDVIFIDFPRSLDTICAIISCLQLSVPFTFCPENKDFPNFRTTLVFDGQEVRRISTNSEEFEDICYVITTSGTTGKRKQVAVPGDCIWPNIDHFCSLFSVTSSDSILFSTSLRFDPSIVELFMAFRSGCTLILTPDHFRSEPFRLQKAIEQFRPTIAQFTATVLEMLPTPDAILNATSSLRILLIGGSHFPQKFIASHRDPNNTTRIFNVYGVTEVSCWATIQEVEMEEEVLIGEPIGGSTLRISEDGELVIGGPRQCFVNGVKREEHPTGDRVEQVETGIRIVGRVDRMIKHRGIRICLDALTSEAIRLNPEASSTYFMHYNNRNLVQFVVGPTSSTRQKYTTTMGIPGTQDTVVPVTVCHVASLPINSSGKVDEKELKKGLETMKLNSGVLDFIEDRLKIRMSDERILEKSAQELGVKSMLAVEIAAFYTVTLQDDVVRTLLDGKTTIREFLEKFPAGEERDGAWSSKITSATTVSVSMATAPPKMLWEVNLGKCIDGNVLVVNDSLVVCASHSGVVCAVNPKNGRVIWRTDCGVRFEATPILVEEEVVIGSKSSGLYFFSLITGTLTAQILSEGVRATCSFDGRFVYCTTENGNFHVIDPVKKYSISTLKVGKEPGGTSIRPVQGPDGSVYAVLTSGWVSRITVDQDGTSVTEWQRNFGPLFAEPIFFKEQLIIILNVHGVLRILNKENGEITAEIPLESGNCFCAPLIIGNQALIATKSGNLVLLDMERMEIQKMFNFSSTFSNEPVSFVKTPKILEDRTLTLISTNGWILAGQFYYELEALELKLEDVKAIRVCEKEIFTEPTFLDRTTVVVAGRDDHLRAWNVDGLL